jgi:hypothetical protein
MSKVARDESFRTPPMSAETSALVEAALVAYRTREQSPEAARRAHRAEADWLHAWRLERGIPDEDGARALAGDARAVWRYLALPRGEHERFSAAALVPPKERGKHRVELAEALRSEPVRDALRACRKQVELADETAHATDEHALYCPRCVLYEIAAGALVGGLVRAGIVPDGVPDDGEADLVRELMRGGVEREDSVLVRLALTSIGWSVDEAKRAVRAVP